ncbi:MAG: DUF2750 domain-containing protein, partial [Candidatus Methylophosphatis roskildensis]
KNVIALDARARYEYFIRKVTDFETVWGLFGQGWATGAANGQNAVPFWPEEGFAALCANDEWDHCSPKEIPLQDFLRKWLPGMDRDHNMCWIFPTRESTGYLVHPLGLKQDLDAELAQYL